MARAARAAGGEHARSLVVKSCAAPGEARMRAWGARAADALRKAPDAAVHSLLREHGHAAALAAAMLCAVVRLP